MAWRASSGWHTPLSSSGSRVRARSQEYQAKGFRAQKWFFRYGPQHGREGMAKNLELVETVRNSVRDTASDLVMTAMNFLGVPYRRGGNSPDGRKVQATLHWVSAEHAKTAEVRLYSPLFRAL